MLNPLDSDDSVKGWLKLFARTLLAASVFFMLSVFWACGSESAPPPAFFLLYASTLGVMVGAIGVVAASVVLAFRHLLRNSRERSE